MKKPDDTIIDTLISTLLAVEPPYIIALAALYVALKAIEQRK